MRKVHNRAGQLFRLAAHSLHHGQTRMEDYLRRMKGRVGLIAATTATAHKIAIIFYTMAKNQRKYDDTILVQRDRELELKRQAQKLGYKLVPIIKEPAA